MNMSVELVSEVQRLVDRYNLENVQRAVKYVADFNMPAIEMRDVFGNLQCRLTEKQYNAVYALFRANDKIAAIKLLREFTGLGLKEAKETVENIQLPV